MADNDKDKDAKAPAKTEEPTRPLDQTVPGGKYIVDGRMVDAQGNEIKD